MASVAQCIDTSAHRAVEIPIVDIGESLGRFRVVDPKVEARLETSIRALGQLSPATVLAAAKAPFELIDGFKRLRVVRALGGVALSVVRLELGTRAAKAAIVTINRAVSRVSDFEESLVVASLADDDGLTQAEVGRLFGRDQSWVSRRIALTKGLCEEAKDEVRLGLMGVAAARELVRMPRGIQPKLLETMRSYSLTSREMKRLIAGLLARPEREWEPLLGSPHDFLLASTKGAPPSRDKVVTKAGLCERLGRLSAHCQAVRKDLGSLREAVARTDEIVAIGAHAADVMRRTVREINSVVVDGASASEVKGA